MYKRKLCVVTGSRADYGLLYCLIKQIDLDPDFELQLMVTGMHLSPEFGSTYKVIETDGLVIQEKVDMLLSSDSPGGTSKSMGLGMIGFADALERLTPDLLIVLGDRFEIMAVVIAAMLARIPIAHIAGGDISEGAFDDAIRHSITKMANLHLVTNADSAERVRQMGENQQYIFNVGSPALDFLYNIELLPREELQKALNFNFRPKNLLVTFHPVTRDTVSSQEQMQALLLALDQFGEQTGLIFTAANADPEGRMLNHMLLEYCRKRENARLYKSLGQHLYWSTIAQVDAVVGNSSSLLYEVPSFKKPSINIGNRQKGRLQADSVINCKARTADIATAIEQSYCLDCSHTINPYGDGNSVGQIMNILKSIPDYKILLEKHFFEVQAK